MFYIGAAALFLLGIFAWLVVLFLGWLGWQYVKRRWLTVTDKEGNVKWRKL